MREQRCGNGGADGEHDWKSREQRETQQRRRDGSEERVIVLVRVGVREQRGEEQRLGDDLRIRIARVPRLYDVHA